MIDINRRKFIAELSKLLTFMYEEDRQTAISMYEKMFDDADDEQALINFLLSPTRQAVIVARAYDAKERKLAIQSQSGSAASCAVGGELPGFIRAINEIHDDAVSTGDDYGAVLEDQISIFGENGADEKSLFDRAYEAVMMPDKKADDETPSAASSSEEPGEADSGIQSAASTEPEIPSVVPSAGGDTNPNEAPAASENETADEIKEEAALPADRPVPAAVPSPEKTEETRSAAYTPALSAPSAAEPEIETSSEVKRKKRVFPLIIYIIFAVPITALGVVILLIPTFLFLIFALALGAAGAAALTSAFGGFAVFADIMVVLGTSLVIIALGLLCLWVFIWFIGEVIVGLINGAINLGGKIAYKEERSL